jgi:hypothetical protein
MKTLTTLLLFFIASSCVAQDSVLVRSARIDTVEAVLLIADTSDGAVGFMYWSRGYVVGKRTWQFDGSYFISPERFLLADKRLLESPFLLWDYRIIEL